MNPSQHAIGQVVEEDHEKKRKAIQIQLDQEIAPIFVEESARKVCEEKPRQKYQKSKAQKLKELVRVTICVINVYPYLIFCRQCFIQRTS